MLAETCHVEPLNCLFLLLKTVFFYIKKFQWNMKEHHAELAHLPQRSYNLHHVRTLWRHSSLTKVPSPHRQLHHASILVREPLSTVCSVCQTATRQNVISHQSSAPVLGISLHRGIKASSSFNFFWAPRICFYFQTVRITLAVLWNNSIYERV